MNDESSPKGAHESATTDLMVTDGSLSLDDRLAAFEAGRQQGKAERVDLDVTAAVHAVLHQQVREMLGFASRSARHGAAFSQLVRESGERE